MSRDDYQTAVRYAEDLQGRRLSDVLEDAVRCDEYFVELALARERLRFARRDAPNPVREDDILRTISEIDELALERLGEVLSGRTEGSA